MICPDCEFISFKALSKCSNCGANLKDRPPEILFLDGESFTVCPSSLDSQNEAKHFRENKGFSTEPKEIVMEKSTNAEPSKSSGNFDLDLSEAENLLHTMMARSPEFSQNSETILDAEDPSKSVNTGEEENILEKPHTLERTVSPKEKSNAPASLSLDVENLNFESGKPTSKSFSLFFKEIEGLAEISPGSLDERMVLGRWIKMGRELIVGTFPLGESILDPNVKRPDDIAKRVEEYVKFDRVLGRKMPHLKGKFRYALETYYRDTWGPYLPSEEDLKSYYDQN